MNRKKYIKSLFIRIIISLLLFLGIYIFAKSSNNNFLLFKNYLYDCSFKFTKISNLYQKYLGGIIKKPSPKEVLTVSNNLNIINYHAYKDGIEVNDVDVISPIKSGIVVFIGEKEDYGNTIIIQGMDGIDYWYGNIDNYNIKMYDYIESNNIIGNAKNNTLYLVFMKDGKILDYDRFVEDNQVIN